MPSADHFEGLPPALSEAENGEVCVETCHATETETKHDRETRPVYDGEVLIRKTFGDPRRNFEVRCADGLDFGGACPETLTEAFGGAPTQAVAQEQPGLHDQVVGSQKFLAAGENRSGAPVASVAAVGCRIPGRRVHEQAHRRVRLLPRSAAIASPTMVSLRREMSAPPESPRS